MYINYFDRHQISGVTVAQEFHRANQNYEKLEEYLIDLDTSGSGGSVSVSYTDLTDTGNTLYPSCFPFTDSSGSYFNLKGFASDSAYGTGLDDTVEIDINSHPDYVIIKVIPEAITNGMTTIIEDIVNMTISDMNTDIDMNGFNIVNIGEITPTMVSDFNTIHSTSYSIDDFVINKRFTDVNYYSKKNPIILNNIKGESSFKHLISDYDNGYVVISNHGFDGSMNGTEIRFNFENDVPDMLNTETVYYMRINDENNISVYTNKNNAITQNSTIAETTRINVSGSASGNEHYLIFNGWNTELYGEYLEYQAVPRKEVVLRSGDKMTGDLILNDHPGEYSGNELTDNKLRAATTYYVDQKISNINTAGSNGPSIIDFQNGDLLSASGYYRMIVSGLTSTSWNNGDEFTEVSDPSKKGILHDIKSIKNGLLHIITFELIGSVFEQDDVITNSIDNAEVKEIYFEYSQSRVNDDSHISINVNRKDYAEYSDNDPVSEISFIIKDNTLTKEMFKDGEKLTIENIDIGYSEVFDDSDWGNAEEEKLGICSFSNETFELLNGNVKIKDQGISLSKISNISNNMILGTDDENDGNIIPIPFSDIIEIGGGITENNFITKLEDNLDLDIFEKDDDKITLKNNGITLSKLSNINSGKFLGRKTTGYGPVEELSLSDLGAGGISENELGDEFKISDDKLVIKNNSISLDKIDKISGMTVLGNSYSSISNVHTISLSRTDNPKTIVYRTNNGSISCNELHLKQRPILKSTQDAVSMYTPTEQLIFTSVCGDSCNFDMSETEFYGSIKADKMTSTAFNDISDENKKIDIETLKDAVRTINQLRGVSFKWIDNYEKSIGLIAQEVEKVLPEIVETDSEGYKSVSYNKLVGLLIEGIKELTPNNVYTTKELYDNGTVVVISNSDNYDLELSNHKNDKNVVGIVKNSYEKDGLFFSELYSPGRVKCNVIGPVNKGDLLVNSAIPGYAIVDNYTTFNKCIGKSIENKKTDMRSVIEIISII